MSFWFNLISVSTLTRHMNVKISFTDSHFDIQDIKHKKMIGKGEMYSDLYVLTSHIEHHSVVVNKVTDQVWHRRLGHISFKRLESLRTNLGFSSCSNHIPCYVCPLAKQKRLPFISHNNRHSRPFDLVHCDI